MPVTTPYLDGLLSDRQRRSRSENLQGTCSGPPKDAEADRAGGVARQYMARITGNRGRGLVIP
jgi:hypothetical protein